MLALAVAPDARASICLDMNIDITAENIPGHLNSGSVEELFDGFQSASTAGDLRLHHPTITGDNALILRFSSGLLHSGTTFDISYSVDEADGDLIVGYVTSLILHGYDASYWDRNGNGLLEVLDFDVDGNGLIGSGDYSPLGMVVKLYNGNPGDPVGSWPGTLVHTAYSPIRPMSSTVYEFTVSAPGDFDHIVIESTPDGNGSDPRIIEIEHNGKPNSLQSLSGYGSSSYCGQVLF